MASHSISARAPKFAVFAILVKRRRRPAVKTFITALSLVFALAGGLSMMALAFRSDFRELAADVGGDWTPPVAVPAPPSATPPPHR
jgi:hypothetical protein